MFLDENVSWNGPWSIVLLMLSPAIWPMVALFWWNGMWVFLFGSIGYRVDAYGYEEPVTEFIDFLASFLILFFDI